MSDKAPTHRVELTDDEILLLDGRCRPGAQASVDAAKARVATAGRFPDLTKEQAAFVAAAVQEATDAGRLSLSRPSLRSCGVCDKRAGYYTFRRGRRKGQADLKRPLSFGGVDLARRTVSVVGYARCGCCADCWGDVKDAVAEAVSGLGSAFFYAGTRALLVSNWPV